MKHIIVGPSHVVRWRHAFNAGATLPAVVPTLFIGRGGAPVWDKALLQDTLAAIDAESRVTLIVGDFRFGNAIAGDVALTRPDEVFQAGYATISRQHLTEANDRELLARSKRALAVWRSTLGERLRVIHWTLLCRQVSDRMRGNYIRDRRYVHPLWNLSDFATNDMDLTPVLRRPMHEVQALYIDQNLHPSFVGYAFLEFLCRDMDVLGAYDRALSVTAQILEAWLRPLPQLRRPLVLAGDSNFVTVAFQGVGKIGRERMAQFNISIAANAKALQAAVAEGAEIVWISGATQAQVAQAASCGDSLAPEGLRPRAIISWDAVMSQVIARRSIGLKRFSVMSAAELSGALDRLQAHGASFLSAKACDGLVDLGEELSPTMCGLLAVLAMAVNADVAAPARIADVALPSA